MAYESLFYIRDNIVGYTGSLFGKGKDAPTVYFREGIKFGRITQWHKKADNIGRNKVRSDASYKIENRNGKAYESWSGGSHPSRNAFIDITKSPVRDSELVILSKAIDNFPDKKTKY